MPGMIDENPELVQPESWARMKFWSGKTPVFLFHDGGGTTFAYHCLEPVKRFVYGVRNPHFFNEKKFDGGLPEMAALYVAWVRECVAAPGFPAKLPGRKPVDILIGGWSLGGMTSLEVARQLAGDDTIRVKGILMIDSVYPGSGPDERLAVAPPETRDAETLAREEVGMSKNQVLSTRAMREARRMITFWKVPTWEGELAGKRPPAILVRAKESLRAQDWSKSIDLNRQDQQLGWKDYDEKMFLEVIDVDGHHFNMFDHSRIPGITAAIMKALTKLDPPREDTLDAWDMAHPPF